MTDLPLPPQQPEKPTRPQTLKNQGQILGPSGGGQIMAPITNGPTNAAEDHEAQEVSREAYADMKWLVDSMWRYENRPRGRSSQAHIGPSELGAACDRKLVYRLMGYKPFTQGNGANWPAIVGTGVHSWLEGMMNWLDQDRGRFLVEHHVSIIDGELEGTLDVYDRLTKRVRDWKAPSARAVRKYKLEGVGTQYRMQGQLYAYGLARQGEDPKDIAVTMIARDASSVEQGLYVEVFPYKPSEARDAVAKFHRLKELSESVNNPLEVEPTPSRLCSWCPFFMPGVKGACAGR